jgi:hypothetical protein
MPSALTSTIANHSPFCDSRHGMKKLEDALSSEDAMHAPLHEIERMVEAQGREVLRAMVQAHFDLRSAQERGVEVRDVKGIEHDDVRRGSRKVETKFGEVEFERLLYQAPGTDGLAPLDAAMELPDEKYSYEVRRIVAEEAPRASFDGSPTECMGRLTHCRHRRWWVPDPPGATVPTSRSQQRAKGGPGIGGRGAFR